MSNKTSQILAIVGLVFMLSFVVLLVMTLVDYTMWNNSVGIIAAVCGAVGIGIYAVLKMHGKGFSIRQMNDEAELKKIQLEAEKAEAELNAKLNASNDDAQAEKPVSDKDTTEEVTHGEKQDESLEASLKEDGD